MSAAGDWRIAALLRRSTPRLDDRRALLRELLRVAVEGPQGDARVVLLAGTMTIPRVGPRPAPGPRPPLPFVMIVEQPSRPPGVRAVEVADLGDIQFLRPTLAVTKVSR
jgi:hypothetical protein